MSYTGSAPPLTFNAHVFDPGFIGEYDLFFGVDGTGEPNEADYDLAYVDSFVKRLSEKFGGANWQDMYLRGPNWSNGIRPFEQSGQTAAYTLFERFGDLTSSAGRIVRDASFFSASMAQNGRNPVGAGGAALSSSQEERPLTPNQRLTLTTTRYPRIFLAGHSRGGAAVIYAANLLKGWNIDVYCMLLFDAVKMSLEAFSPDVEKIPDNVQYCFHAMRDPATLSRPDWGNCGEGPESAGRTAFYADMFFCTHGGMGGTPWIDHDELLSPLNYDEALELDGNPGIDTMSDNQLAQRGLTFQKAANQQIIAAGASRTGNYRYVNEKGGKGWDDYKSLIPYPTNVTLDQDISGSSRVGRWMAFNLSYALKGCPGPYVDPLQ